MAPYDRFTKPAIGRSWLGRHLSVGDIRHCNTPQMENHFYGYHSVANWLPIRTGFRRILLDSNRRLEAALLSCITYFIGLGGFFETLLEARLPSWGARGRVFESLRPDHIFQGVARFYLATPFYYSAFLPPQNHWLWCEFTPFLALFRAAFGTNPV